MEKTIPNLPASRTARIIRQLPIDRDILAAPARVRGALLYWATLLALSAAASHTVGVLTHPWQSRLLMTLLLSLAALQIAGALAAVVSPTRSRLLAAASVEGLAVLSWFLVRTVGIPLGSTVWRPETLGVMDQFLLGIEAVSTIFYLAVLGQVWITAPRVLRLFLRVLPALLGLACLAFIARDYPIVVVSVVVFVFTSNLPGSLVDLCLPAVGLMGAFLLLRAVLPRVRVATPEAGRAMLLVVPAILIISPLTWAAASTAAARPWFPDSASVNAPAGQTTTLAYCSPGGDPLAMDLSEPVVGATRPAPAAIYIHGGAGIDGDRILTGSEGPYLAQLRDTLVQRGFVVGSIDYRLAPRYSFGDQYQDAACAVRFLRGHASELGIDPTRIGVYGDSEGGYLASLLGTGSPRATLVDSQYLNQPSGVEAVVDMWGPADLTDFSGSPSWVGTMTQGLTGGKTSLAQARAASPVTNVAPGDPPFLIIHGTDDWFIAPHHSVELANRLRAAGDSVTLVMVQHGGHGLADTQPGTIQQPSPDGIIQLIANFLPGALAPR